jgi:hypothetical protein
MLPSERWEVAGIVGGIVLAQTLVVVVAVRLARRIDAAVTYALQVRRGRTSPAD